jgi:hypothetical protein
MIAFCLNKLAHIALHNLELDVTVDAVNASIELRQRVIYQRLPAPPVGQDFGVQ